MLRASNSIDLISVKTLEDATSNDSVILRIGNLTNLNKHDIANGEEQPVTGDGFYSSKIIVDKISYTKEYHLGVNDNSSNLASTEWINKVFPKGTILMFNGESSDIPECWAICDGTNNTPNLIGKFIKAGLSSGEEGGSEEITLTVDNLPSHTHTIQSGSITTSSDGEHSHSYTEIASGVGSITEGENNIITGT